jgi:hypothetical protein
MFIKPGSLEVPGTALFSQGYHYNDQKLVFLNSQKFTLSQNEVKLSAGIIIFFFWRL